MAQYQYMFIKSNIMMFHIESEFQQPKVFVVGTIIEKEKLTVGVITTEEILLKARKQQISLPFPFLITNLYDRGGVPFQGNRVMRITPASSSYIHRIEAKYLLDDVAQRKPPPPGSTPIVNLTTLIAKASTPAPSMEQVCICSTMHPPLVAAR